MKAEVDRIRDIRGRIRSRTADLVNEIRLIREMMASSIESLPQNPRFGDFGVMSSDLEGKSWCSSYHDFRSQYRVLADLVRNGSVGGIVSRLKRALRDEQVGCVRLHPDVMTHVRELL